MVTEQYLISFLTLLWHLILLHLHIFSQAALSYGDNIHISGDAMQHAKQYQETSSPLLISLQSEVHQPKYCAGKLMLSGGKQLSERKNVTMITWFMVEAV